MDMIIEVAARYGARVRPRNAREFRDQTFGVAVTVDVRELTADEAPVAVSMDVPIGTHHHVGRRPVRPMLLREVDGRLFGPVEERDRDGEPTGAVCDAAWLARVSAADDRRSYGPFRDLMGNFDVRPVPRIGDARISAVESSGMDDVVSAVHRRAADLAIVDGALWRAVPEPRLVLGEVRNAEGREMEGYVFFGPPGEHDRISPGAVHRLDESDLALEGQRYIIDELDYVVHMPRIDVVRPGLLRLDACGEYLAHAAKRTLEHMAKHLAERPLSYMTAFVGLRDALPAFAEAVRAGADADHAGIVGLMEATHAERVAVEGPHRIHDDVAAAVDRWRRANQVPEDVATLTL